MTNPSLRTIQHTLSKQQTELAAQLKTVELQLHAFEMMRANLVAERKRLLELTELIRSLDATTTDAPQEQEHAANPVTDQQPSIPDAGTAETIEAVSEVTEAPETDAEAALPRRLPKPGTQAEVVLVAASALRQRSFRPSEVQAELERTGQLWQNAGPTAVASVMRGLVNRDLLLKRKRQRGRYGIASEVSSHYRSLSSPSSTEDGASDVDSAVVAIATTAERTVTPKRTSQRTIPEHALELAAQSDAPISAKQLATHLDERGEKVPTRGSLYTTLARLAKEGRLARVDSGRYTLPPQAPTPPTLGRRKGRRRVMTTDDE